MKAGDELLVKIIGGKAITTKGIEIEIDSAEVDKLNEALKMDTSAVKNSALLVYSTTKGKNPVTTVSTTVALCYQEGKVFSGTFTEEGKILIPIKSR